MIRLTLLALVLGSPAAAQEVSICDDFRSSAFALADPWEANTRLFANGEVRLAVSDTIEPAAGAFHLIVISPPYDELGLRQCRVVSDEGGVGFGGLSLDGIEATYDPATGLGFGIASGRYDLETGEFRPATLRVTLNQATGEIIARLD
jgi:hypothetical protein